MENSFSAGEKDVSLNLEQTINKTLQWNQNVPMGNRSKKSLLPSSIYDSNYYLNDKTSNDFESHENRNAIDKWHMNANVDDYDGGGGATALPTTQESMRADEKSISIKNHSNYPPLNYRSFANKRHTNIINDPSLPYCLKDQQSHQQIQQQQSNQQPYGSKSTFETVYPMKTQCETYCKCCTFSNSNSLIMQHSIGMFKLCSVRMRHISFNGIFFLFVGLFLTQCSFFLSMLHFSSPKPS